MTNDDLPFVEDLVVIRRRIRINGGATEQSVVVWTSTKDSDYTLAMLERAKWKVGHRDHIYEPDMRVEGLTEPDEE
jgi:hypothetical protein